MKLDIILSAVAGILNIIAFGIYNTEIFAGNANPNITSWAIWSFITILNFTSYRAMSKDWMKSILPTISSLLCILTLVLALFQGKFKGFVGSDYVVMSIGLTASYLWWSLKSPTITNMMLQVAIAVGFIPTFQSVWARPDSEIPVCWFMWTISSAVQIIVVLLRWKGQARDLAYPINCTWTHLVVALIAIR